MKKQQTILSLLLSVMAAVLVLSACSSPMTPGVEDIRETEVETQAAANETVSVETEAPAESLSTRGLSITDLANLVITTAFKANEDKIEEAIKKGNSSTKKVTRFKIISSSFDVKNKSLDVRIEGSLKGRKYLFKIFGKKKYTPWVGGTVRCTLKIKVTTTSQGIKFYISDVSGINIKNVPHFVDNWFKGTIRGKIKNKYYLVSYDSIFRKLKITDKFTQELIKQLLK